MNFIMNWIKKMIQVLRVLILILKYGVEKLLEDPLTGTYNRIPFKDYTEREMKRAERYKRHLYFIMVDVDRLKIINDGEGGHPAGDKALKTVAIVLKKNCRKTDLTFRLGGDEFGILMSETGKSGVKQFFKRVKEELRGFSLSVSMGSCFWRKGMTFEELIEKADISLYIDKNLKKKKPEEI